MQRLYFCLIWMIFSYWWLWFKYLYVCGFVFSTATIMSCGWIIYLTYYNSRNIGLILTVIINRLYKNGYIHIGKVTSLLASVSLVVCSAAFNDDCVFLLAGSFSFSVLSGKVMFRDVYYINKDMSIRWGVLEFKLFFFPSLKTTFLYSPPRGLFVFVYGIHLSVTVLYMFASRIQDGLLIFRWWKMYNPKQKLHGQ